MAMPTRRQALIAAFLQDGWNLHEDLCTAAHNAAHKVLECEGRTWGKVWISPNGYVRISGEYKSTTKYVRKNPGDAKETIEEMITRGRNVLS